MLWNDSLKFTGVYLEKANKNHGLKKNELEETKNNLSNKVFLGIENYNYPSSSFKFIYV